MPETLPVTMSWVNYHSHSLFCDGKAVAEEYVKAATEKGFHAYGFSSHAPVPFDSRWNMKQNRLPEYLQEIRRIQEAYRDSLEVYAALEVDYIPGLWGYRSTELHNLGLDYVIGSVHYLRPFDDGTYFCFDGRPDAFFVSADRLYANDFRKLITEYYHRVRQMVEHDKPDIVGHMDKIKMHNTVKAYFDEDETWYRNEVEETLDLIAEKECMLEVNTRGLYKHDPPLLYPGRRVLESVRRRKIPVVMNSDAHLPGEIDGGFSQTAALLREIGFRTLRVFSKGRWEEKPFHSDGIMW